MAKVWIPVATVFVMLAACLAIAAIHLVKLLRSSLALKARDPFHNSRQHPLNSAAAPRG